MGLIDGLLDRARESQQREALAAYGQKHFANNPEIADLFSAAPDIAIQMLPKIMEGQIQNQQNSALAALVSGGGQTAPNQVGPDAFSNNMVSPEQAQQVQYQNPMDLYLEAANRDPQAFHAAAPPELFKQVASYAMEKQKQDAEKAAKKKEERAKSGELSQGRQDIEDALNEMLIRSAKLADTGNKVIASEGALANLAPNFRTSLAGRALQTWFAPEAEALRKDIEGRRSDFANIVKQKSGMSAKSMDSNAELQNFLKSFGDPANPYETDLSLLSNMSKRFGTGGISSVFSDSVPQQMKKEAQPDVYEAEMRRRGLLK